MFKKLLLVGILFLLVGCFNELFLSGHFCGQDCDNNFLLTDGKGICPPIPSCTPVPTPIPIIKRCGTDCDGSPIMSYPSGQCPGIPSCAPTPTPLPVATPTPLFCGVDCHSKAIQPENGSCPEVPTCPTNTPTPTPPPVPDKVTFSTIKAILKNHCTPCHVGGTTAGVNFDSNTSIKERASGLRSRIFVFKDMPPGGGKMTDEERQQVADWVNEGASLD